MRGLRSILLLSAAGLFAASAHSATILAVTTRDAANQHGTLETRTGGSTLSTTQWEARFGMSFAPNGDKFGTSSATPSAGVYRITPGTGSVALLGFVAESTTGSAIGSDEEVYAESQDASATFLTIEPAILAVIVVNSGLGFASDGLAFFANGFFYMDDIREANDILESGNPVTGVAVQRTGLETDLDCVANIDGIIYAAGGGGKLYAISASTRLATGARPITIDQIGEIADSPTLQATPEPDMGVLGGLGFALAGAVSAIRLLSAERLIRTQRLMVRRIPPTANSNPGNRQKRGAAPN
jgi:hypothetical protein